jgi:hypothetical protein
VQHISVNYILNVRSFRKQKTRLGRWLLEVKQ